MKRAIVAALALCALLAALSGCGKAKTYAVPWDQFCLTLEDSREIRLRAAEKDAVVDILNRGVWTDGLSDCDCDYVLYTQRQTVRYASGSGIFNDLTRQKSLTVPQAQRQRINGFLTDGK